MRSDGHSTNDNIRNDAHIKSVFGMQATKILETVSQSDTETSINLSD